MITRAFLMKDEEKELIAKLKSEKYSHFIFSLRHPYSIDLEMIDMEKDPLNNALIIREAEQANDSEHREQLPVFVANVAKGRK